MITVQNLSKSYGALRAVDDISFEVNKGELFGLLGPNGAGKTTTISMICGLLSPDSGRVHLDGMDIQESPLEARRRLGVVPQDVALYEELSARENLRFWGGLYGLSGRDLRRATEEILERVGLTDRAKEPVKRFSGGMKRRLNMAAGLIHKPSIVLLDEPTVGIDPQARINILDVVREIAKAGATILYTTHYLEEAEDLCDRIAIMDHGKILALGTVQELAKLAGDADILSIRGQFSTDQIQPILTERPDLEVLNVTDGLAVVGLKHGHGGVSPFLESIYGAQISIDDISIKQPSLQSVFLKLTGRELRD
ncbi:MAG: ABC transporter ATP-binding protein [bacterium]